jgi:hypothetical protein
MTRHKIGHMADAGPTKQLKWNGLSLHLEYFDGEHN